MAGVGAAEIGPACGRRDEEAAAGVAIVGEVGAAGAEGGAREAGAAGGEEVELGEERSSHGGGFEPLQNGATWPRRRKKLTSPLNILERVWAITVRASCRVGCR